MSTLSIPSPGSEHQANQQEKELRQSLPREVGGSPVQRWGFRLGLGTFRSVPEGEETTSSRREGKLNQLVVLGQDCVPQVICKMGGTKG